MEGQGSPRGEAIPEDLAIQCLVVLPGTSPLVWRRILVPSTYSFWDLHVAIQDAMGWFDCHLHEFSVVDPRSATLTRLSLPEPGSSDPDSVRAHFLWHYLSGFPAPIAYLYDFGDEWLHTVVVEGFDESEGVALPLCLEGAGACPPEDCGGPARYREILTVLADPSHRDYAEIAEWTGGPIDPHDWRVDDVVFDDPEQRWREATEEGPF
jgi:hypothetical protein